MTYVEWKEDLDSVISDAIKSFEVVVSHIKSVSEVSDADDIDVDEYEAHLIARMVFLQKKIENLSK